MACAGRGVCPGGRVGTSSAQARTGSAQAFETVERGEAPCDDRNGTRPAPSADHRGLAGHRDGRGLARPDRAGRSRGRAAVRGSLPRRGARGRAGSDDGVAVRRRRAPGGRGAGPPRGASRDGGAAWDQEARQERSRRRAPPARVADGRPLAGVVDSARAPARSARAGAAAAHAGRCAPRVAAADAGGALPPRRPVAQLADDRGVARVAGAARTARDGARADHDRAVHDRRARPPDSRPSIANCANTRAAKPAAGR